MGMLYWNIDFGGFFVGFYNNSLGGGMVIKNFMFYELYVCWV